MLPPVTRRRREVDSETSRGRTGSPVRFPKRRGPETRSGYPLEVDSDGCFFFNGLNVRGDIPRKLNLIL